MPDMNDILKMAQEAQNKLMQAQCDIADLLDKSANTHTAIEENQTQMFIKYGGALNH